jgi:CRP-like cAMP-binding protein
LIDRNGFVVVVPNGLVAGQRLVNYGGDRTEYRTALRVPLDPTLPVARAKRILLSGALDAARRFVGLNPDVLLTEYANGAAVYAVRFRVPDFAGEATCRDLVASCVLNALHCAGETIQHTDLGSSGCTAPQRSRREALLGHVDLFRAFDEAERAELAAKMRPQALDTGQAVVRQGEAGDCLYVLAEGVLDVEIDRAEAAFIQDRIAPGEVFGEVSLLTGQPRGATVTAAIESQVYEIHRADLNPILSRRPEIAEALAAVMAARHARNDRYSRLPEQAPPPTRDDFLARLRLLFHL